MELQVLIYDYGVHFLSDMCTHTHTYIYIMEYYSAIKNIATCCNVDRPRDYHTKWNKSDRDRHLSFDIVYRWNLRKKYTDEHIYKTEIDPQTWKTNSWLPNGKGNEG